MTMLCDNLSLFHHDSDYEVVVDDRHGVTFMVMYQRGYTETDPNFAIKCIMHGIKPDHTDESGFIETSFSVGWFGEVLGLSKNCDLVWEKVKQIAAEKPCTGVTTFEAVMKYECCPQRIGYGSRPEHWTSAMQGCTMRAFLPPPSQEAFNSLSDDEYYIQFLFVKEMAEDSGNICRTPIHLREEAT